MYGCLVQVAHRSRARCRGDGHLESSRHGAQLRRCRFVHAGGKARIGPESVKQACRPQSRAHETVCSWVDADLVVDATDDRDVHHVSCCAGAGLAPAQPVLC